MAIAHGCAGRNAYAARRNHRLWQDRGASPRARNIWKIPIASWWAFTITRPSGRRRWREKFGAKAFDTVDELISQVDAVSVCSANIAHAEATIRALDAGRHVLCEKPMATTLADCEAMVAASRRSGKLLMLGHNQLFAEAHVRARALIAAGEIGAPLMFHTTFGHSAPRSGRARPTRGSLTRSAPCWACWPTWAFTRPI